MRAEAGREPHDRALRELVGELSTLSPEFRTMWAAHDVRVRVDGVKRLEHPDVGRLELTSQSLDLPTPNRTVHDLPSAPPNPAPRPKSASSSWQAWRPPGPRSLSPPSSCADRLPRLPGL
ncbi:hypothetical protein AB0D59_29860 [Streptomyces sp. NPDC048417]|uniref:MmyB family transcriptional regulator n=1 Tax=Streptomyces sp. NPDC048417 TaxID=3155387 RepID=UPI00343EB2D6